MAILSIIVRQVLDVVKKYIIEAILGGADGLLFALIIFMAVEYLTQILVAIRNRKKSDEIGFAGVAKKLSIFFLVAMGNVIDGLIMQSVSMIRMAVILFYLYFEGGIIMNNVSILGLPIPQKLKDILEQFKDGKK